MFAGRELQWITVVSSWSVPPAVSCSCSYHFVCLAGGVSLLRSGLVPSGRLIPFQEIHHGGMLGGRSKGEVDEADVNLHLLPNNTNPQDCFGAHCVVKREREGVLTRTLLLLHLLLHLFSRCWAQSCAQSPPNIRWTPQFPSAGRDPQEPGEWGHDYHTGSKQW